MAKVRIIVVNYNTNAALVNFVKTLYDFTNPDEFNLLIVDNGSKKLDFPEVFFKKKNNIELVKFEKNMGLTKAWNYGIKASYPADIVIAGSDVEFYNKNWLRKLVEVAKEPLCGMIHSHCLRPDMTENLKYRRYYPPYSNDTSEVKRMRHDCVYIKRKLYDDVGLYNEEFFVFGSDVDLQRRAVAKGWKLMYCGSSKVLHYGGLSSSRAPKNIKNADDEMFMKIYGKLK